MDIGVSIRASGGKTAVVLSTGDVWEISGAGDILANAGITGLDDTAGIVRLATQMAAAEVLHRLAGGAALTSFDGWTIRVRVGSGSNVLAELLPAT